MKKLNATDLPLQCPSDEELERFLQKSLYYEELLYPNQTKADLNLKEHETSLYEYVKVKKNKFCYFDWWKMRQSRDSFGRRFHVCIVTQNNDDSVIPLHVSRYRKRPSDDLLDEK